MGCDLRFVGQGEKMTETLLPAEEFLDVRATVSSHGRFIHRTETHEFFECMGGVYGFRLEPDGPRIIEGLSVHEFWREMRKVK